MYIGGTDEKALHHLFAEVIDNAMDEALAGHADWIEVEMRGRLYPSPTMARHSGRSAPEIKNKSALEVIMHARGRKFDSEVYDWAGCRRRRIQANAL